MGETHLDFLLKKVIGLRSGNDEPNWEAIAGKRDRWLTSKVVVMEGELDVFGIHFGGIIDELGELQGVGGNGEEGINRIPRYKL